MKPAWLLVGIIGLSAGIALTREHAYVAPAVEPERPSALGVASPDLDDDTPQQVVAPATADSASEPSGEVLESLDVASYTYLRLKTTAGEVWAAVPRATVHVHDQVQIAGATLMRDFESKTLKRTFPSIYFGSLAGAGTRASVGNALPPGHPPIDSAGNDPYAPGTPLPPGHPRIDSLPR